MRRWLPWILGAIALAAVVAVGLSQAPESKTPSQPKVSKISAEELRTKLGGAPPALAAVHAQANDLLPGARKGLQARVKALRGHPVVVNVWASWCVTCRDEHPVLVDFAATKRVPLVGLNYKDQREDALKWLSRFGDPYQFSVVDADGRIGIDYGVYGVPETYLIDRAGMIRFKQIGPVTPDLLKAKILPMIAELEK